MSIVSSDCTVYALNELVQVCNKQPDDAKHIAASLLGKVASSNPVVKYKVCSPCTALSALPILQRMTPLADDSLAWLHLRTQNRCRCSHLLQQAATTCHNHTPAAWHVSTASPTVQALRAIRYICQNSTTSLFKKACGGVSAAVIREALSWTGPPHPQLGNSLNMRVRDAAKETLEEVFRIAPPSVHGHPPSAPAAAGPTTLRGRIQGYGSTTGMRIVNSYAGSSGLMDSGGGGGGGGGKTGKYGGFGSDDVRVAEAAGGSWMTAAQQQVRALTSPELDWQ